MSPRLSEPEREALRQAAFASAPVIAKLKLERQDLDVRIARLEAVVSAYEELLGKRPKRVDGEAPGKAPRGQVGEHVDAILAGGGDYKESEIRQAIWERFGIKYARGATYTVLRRGDGKKYEQKEKRWRLRIE
jgi:hypothetical protein